METIIKRRNFNFLKGKKFREYKIIDTTEKAVLIENLGCVCIEKVLIEIEENQMVTKRFNIGE